MSTPHTTRVMIVGGSAAGLCQYGRMFRQNGYDIVSKIDQADLLCFTGGEDVSPHLYDEPKHPATHNNLIRDVYEGKIFEEAVSALIPMVGICRGGQFLNVKNGGKMYQDVSKHTMFHPIYDKINNKRVYASSTHHQMMRPGLGADIVAVAYEEAHKEYMAVINGEARIIYDPPKNDDIEVVYYKDTDSLCFQPHPEFDSPALQELKEYFFTLLRRYFNL